MSTPTFNPLAIDWQGRKIKGRAERENQEQQQLFCQLVRANCFQVYHGYTCVVMKGVSDERHLYTAMENSAWVTRTMAPSSFGGLLRALYRVGPQKQGRAMMGPDRI